MAKTTNWVLQINMAADMAACHGSEQLLKKQSDKQTNSFGKSARGIYLVRELSKLPKFKTKKRKNGCGAGRFSDRSLDFFHLFICFY